MRFSRIICVLLLVALAACSESSTGAQPKEVAGSVRADAAVDSVATAGSGAARGGNTMGSGH
jgi:hypothetical protein